MKPRDKVKKTFTEGWTRVIYGTVKSKPVKGYVWVAWQDGKLGWHSEKELEKCTR